MTTKQYFTHDYNARNDPKILALCQDFGAAGYGIFWCLVEMMNEQGGKIKKFPSLYSAIANDFKIREATLLKQIEAMLHKYNLLVEDENYLWSESVLERLEIRKQKSLRRSVAGKEGGIKSGKSRRSKQNEAMLQHVEANEANKRKGKEIKGKRDTERAHDISNSNLFRTPTIPNIQQVIECFIQAGGTDDMANKFFLKHSATEWYLNNSPIRNFQSLVPSFIENWNRNNGENFSGIKKMVM